MTDRSSLHPGYFPHLQIRNAREKWLLNGIRVSRELATRLVLFFLPLFLYQQGDAVRFFGPNLSGFQQGLLWVALYFLCRNLVSVITSIWLMQTVKKVGLHRSLAFGQLGLVVYFWVLFQATQQPGLVFLAAALDGMQVIFWASYLTVLSQNSDHTQLVSDISVINFLLALVSIVVSILGGWLAVWLGFSALFLVGIAMLLVGMIFALQLKPYESQDSVSWLEFGRWLSERGYQKLALSYVGRYWNDAAQVLWPLYVFFLVGTIDRVGYLYGLSLFLALIVAYLATHWVVTEKNRHSYWFSGGILSVLWFFRTGVGAIWSIVTIDALERLTSNFHWLFFDTQFLSRGKGSEALSFFTYREVLIATSAVVFWSIFIMLFALWLWPLKYVFVLAGLGIWLTLLVQQHKQT
jgi:hypothetical protein